MANCKQCQRPIVWARVGDVWRRFDLQKLVGGNYEVDLIGKRAADVAVQADDLTPRHQRHEMSCPNESRQRGRLQ